MPIQEYILTVMPWTPGLVQKTSLTFLRQSRMIGWRTEYKLLTLAEGLRKASKEGLGSVQSHGPKEGIACAVCSAVVQHCT